MEALSNGLVTLLNGFGQMITSITSPITVAFIVCALALTWLARIEIDELDRQGTKPDVGRH